MNIKIIFLSLALFTISFTGTTQETKERNKTVTFPDIPGYMSLKADFHLHTVFSDGHVWPSFRVREAQADGLDIISLTEHIDYEGYPQDLEYTREKAFEIAQETAKNTDVLVIRGIEISPRVPPYHNNAIFLKNVDVFPYDYMKETHQQFVMKDTIQREELLAPFLEVQRQGGFIFYNHPSYNWWDKKDKELFTEIHKELLSKGILGGVEVVNSGRYNVIAHRMAEKYNLTMFSNSDEHYDTASSYKDSHRPMTIVFATEKTPEAVKEALLARRTLVYFDDYLIGRKQEAEAFFQASLAIKTKKEDGKNAPKLIIHITNNSMIPYEVKCSSEYIIENLPLGRLTLEPQETTSLVLNPVWEYPEQVPLRMEVENVLISPEEALRTIIEVKIDH